MPRDLLCVMCLGQNGRGRTNFCLCYGPWYCSRECQKAHWQVHKRECTYYLVRSYLRMELPEEIVMQILQDGITRNCDQ